MIDVAEETIRVLDSMAGFEWDLSWLQGLLRRTLKFQNDAAVVFEDCRQQGNVHDCGVYAMANLRSFVESADFNSPRMPGTHLEFKEKEAAVMALRQQFASELRKEQLHPWEQYAPKKEKNQKRKQRGGRRG